jgi:hypothetical protein
MDKVQETKLEWDEIKKPLSKCVVTYEIYVHMKKYLKNFNKDEFIII